MHSKKPIVWIIAGVDNTSGAGLFLDVRVMSSLGVHPCGVVSAVTAQSETSVVWETVSEVLLRAQIETLLESYPPQVVKLGMLGSAENVTILSEYLDILKGRGVKIVCDPIIATSSGYRLLDPDAQILLTKKIFPFVDVCTPNIPEAETLLGEKIESWVAMERAAKQFLELGVRFVVVKGGHHPGLVVADYGSDGQQQAWLVQDRVEGVFRGTGCTLSSALAAALCTESEVLDAWVVAKAFVQQSLQQAGSNTFLNPSGWPHQAGVLPWLVRSASEIEQRYAFPECGPQPIAFYPIVPSAAWVKRLVGLGVKTIQLRVKDLQGEALKREVAEVVAMGKREGCRVFVNDAWALAIELGAYGVHLGQEDLQTADLRAIEKAGLRLGVSTHSYGEMSRALALRPSYIAVGPIYPTTCKSMRFGPQGLNRLRQFRALLPGPVVAIGGITLEKAPDVLATGVEGIAVVSDVVNSKNVDARISDWMQILDSSSCVLK